MTIEIGWMQNQAYDSIEDRIVIEGIATDEGVQKPTHFKVIPSSGLTINVRPGTAFVRGSTVANQGMYVIRSTANEPITHTTAPTGGNSRIDLVILEVVDGQVTGAGTAPANNLARVRIVAGTAGTSPSAPALPASSLLLGTVTLTSGLATIATGNISNGRNLGGRGPHIGDVRVALSSTMLKYGEIPMAGQAISRTTYADLFEIYGTLHGAGDGSTTFNVPDMRGRMTIGLDNLGGNSLNLITDAAADVIGGAGGVASLVLVANQIPAHQHPITHDHASVTSGVQSSDHTHNMVHSHAESADTGGAGFSKRVPGAGSADVFNVGTGVTVTYHANPATSTFSGITGGVSVNHTHNVDLPSYSGNSGDNPTAGSAVVIVQPYRAVAMYVKAL